MDYTPLVLKNKGVPCEFAKVKKFGPKDDDWAREYDETGEPVIEVLNVRFTNNVIAELEQHWGGLEKWQQSLETMPVSTIRQTFAYALRKSNMEVGEAMLDGEQMKYSNIIGVAWAIANGVDPTIASRLLAQSVALANEQKRIITEALATQENEIADSLGDSGSQPGPKRAARSKNSGK